MKSVFNIARAELQTLFFSPVAWLIIIIFTFQTSMGFTDVMESWVRYFVQGYKATGMSMDVFANQQTGIYWKVLNYLYLYIPLLTMGLMSREFSSGSIKLLYSSPVTNTQIILGKFLSMMVYGLILVSILLIYILVAGSTVQAFEWKAVWMGLLGIFLLICAYAAIGLFMSSLTSYQVVAAMGTLAVLAILNYISTLWQDVAFVRDLTYWVAISGRTFTFIVGLFSSEDFLYFIIVVALFLMLTIIRLQSARQKTKWSASLGKYFVVIAGALMLGYFTSLPSMMYFYDATSTKVNTLTPASQEVIKKLKGDLTITTYTNILDDQNLWIASPRAIKADQARFMQYLRFKPDTKLKYVYYYDSAVENPGLKQRYPNLSAKERVDKIIDLQDLNLPEILTAEEVRKKIDLFPEGNKFVRSLQLGNGNQTFLRIYDDQMILPGETEITAAMKRLTMETLPKVGFLQGHGERNNRLRGDRNYNRFAGDKPFRYALVNQGFDMTDVSLDKEVPKDVNIIVIADMRVALNASEKANLDQYVARGGNLLILGEAKRQQAMDELIAPFGVSFIPGTLVDTSGTNLDDFIISRPTEKASDVSYVFGQMKKNKRVVTMPGAVGLDYTTDKGFEVTPIFVTDSLCWNELETTNFIDDSVKLNTAIGETQKSFTTGLALSRKIGNKTQKIMILGDADCISNGEISIQRQFIYAANYSVVMGSFHWMSDSEVPIDVRRPQSKDDATNLDKAGMSSLKVMLTWGFSGLLFIAAIILWIRRRGR